MPLPKAGNTRQNQAFNLSQNFVALRERYFLRSPLTVNLAGLIVVQLVILSALLQNSISLKQ